MPHDDLVFRDPAALFRDSLAKEVLASERRRLALMAGFFGVCLVVSLFYIAVPAGMSPEFRASFMKARPIWLTFYLVILLYQLTLWVAVGRYLREGQTPPRFVQYLNAVIEISIPSIAVVASMSTMEPIQSLFVPPALFYFVLILLTTLQLDYRLCLFAGAAAAAEYLAVVVYATRLPHRPDLPAVVTDISLHISRAGVLALTGMAAAFVASQIRGQFAASVRSMSERNRAIDIFGQHVSPQVAEKLLAQAVEVGPEAREVCVMFVDIRGFTRFADGKSPAQVMAYLNDLFGPLIEVVNANHGIINKFLGDGFMAVFGAPVSDGQSSRNAVAAATAIVREVARMSDANLVPRTRIGIGLHAGSAMTGNVGSAARKEYTVIGDVVNLAARVEQLNKQFDSDVLITQAVWETLPTPDRTTYPCLGPVPVRGQENPVTLYKLA